MKKIAIITGGSSGFGLAMAKVFKNADYIVIITGKNEEKLKRAALEACVDDYYAFDVKEYDSWMKFKDYIMNKYGRVDVLINNAGGGVRIQRTENFSREEIDETIALNLNSVIYSASLFAPIFKAQKNGTIVNISSVCARHCWGEWSVYAAAKAGVLNFSKGLYVEMQPYGVRVTCVIPASASTGFQKSAKIGEVQRSLQVEDIANSILYCCQLPATAVVEEMTVWGIDQIVEPM